MASHLHFSNKMEWVGVGQVAQGKFPKCLTNSAFENGNDFYKLRLKPCDESGNAESEAPGSASEPELPSLTRPSAVAKPLNANRAPPSKNEHCCSAATPSLLSTFS